MRATLLNRSAHYYCPLILCPRALPLPPLSAMAAAAPHATRHTPHPHTPTPQGPKPQAPLGWLHFYLLFAFGGRIPPHNSGGEVRISSLSGTRHKGAASSGPEAFPVRVFCHYTHKPCISPFIVLLHLHLGSIPDFPTSPGLSEFYCCKARSSCLLRGKGIALYLQSPCSLPPLPVAI